MSNASFHDMMPQWKHAITYESFLGIVIKIGVKSASANYKKDSNLLDGAVNGFEACRNMQPADIIELYKAAKLHRDEAYLERDIKNYWWFRCYESEVAWVLSCLSYAFKHNFIPNPIQRAEKLTNNILYKGQTEVEEIVVQPVGIKGKGDPTRFDVIGIDMHGKRHFLAFFNFQDYAYRFAKDTRTALLCGHIKSFQEIADTAQAIRRLIT